MFECPLCGELVQYLTNNHCITKHNMTRKELIKKYGSPKYKGDMRSREINAWINKTTYVIHESNFGYAQASAKSVRKKG